MDALLDEARRSSVGGKVALITGGAKDLGAATAQRLAEKGARVVIVDLEEHPAGQPAGDQVMRLKGDVTDLSDMIRAVDTAEAHVQHILAKLGFNSRAQIASWVVQQRASRS